MLFAAGELYARLLPESAQGRAASAAGAVKVGTFLGAGVGSYLDQPWTEPMWKPFGAKNGTAFMLGWPVAHRQRAKRTTRTDLLAAGVFALYPLAWWLGWDHGRRRRPRS